MNYAAKMENLVTLALSDGDFREEYWDEIFRLITRGMYLDAKESVIKDALNSCIEHFPVSKVSKYEKALDSFPKDSPNPTVERMISMLRQQ